MEEKIKIVKSNFGKGIFATKLIKKGETICFLKGEEISMEEVERRYELGTERRGDPLQIGIKKYIDLDEPYIYFNHSCNPNAGIKGKNELVAIKDIKPEEEITFDYSTTMWDEEWAKKHEPWTMKCGCKSKNCRGIVKDFPTLPKYLKESYIKKKILPDFILKKI